MAIRSSYHVILPNQPGTALELARRLGNAGVKIEAAVMISHEDHSEFEGLFSDMAATAQVLDAAGYTYHEVRSNLVWLPDREGSLADALTLLAEAGINIESLYMIGTEEREQRFALTCSDPDQAEAILRANSFV